MLKRILKFYVVLFVGFFPFTEGKCQKIAVKTNLLYDLPALPMRGWNSVGHPVGHWTYRRIITVGHFPTGGDGSIGFCSRKCVIGFVTVLQDILSEDIFWADSLMSVA